MFFMAERISSTYSLGKAVQHAVWVTPHTLLEKQYSMHRESRHKSPQRLHATSLSGEVVQHAQ